MIDAGRLFYGQVENIIARMLYIPDELRPALRDRLRHLRKMGVPELPSVGSGGRVLYTYEQTLEMLVAISMISLGQDPGRAKSLAKAAASGPILETLQRRPQAHLYLHLVLNQVAGRPLAYIADVDMRMDPTNKVLPFPIGTTAIVLNSMILENLRHEMKKEQTLA
jgi:hypothetical protein